MGDGSLAVRAEAFIKAFSDTIVPGMGVGLGSHLIVEEEGLIYLDALNEVRYYLRVRPEKSTVVFTLVSQEQIYAPWSDHEDYNSEELLIERIQIYTGLTSNEIIIRLQEAGLR